MAAIRILLADNHPVVREGVRALLERAHGLAVVGEASDGPEALCLAVELAPDVLILELQLPTLSGVEVARQLRARGAAVRVLGLSAHTDTEDIIGLLDAGAGGCLLKDEAGGRIVEAVRGVARGERGWLSHRVAARIVQREGTARGAKLTDRERQLLAHLSAGESNAHIAQTLNLGLPTVSNYLSALYTKLGVRNRHAAVAWARARDLA